MYMKRLGFEQKQCSHLAEQKQKAQGGGIKKYSSINTNECV